MEVLFFLSLSMILYTYIFYPLILMVLALHSKARPFDKPETFAPEVSFIMAAYNEERFIHQKIENCLAIDYPPDRLEIIIVSDGSTDQTNKIIQSFLPNPQLRFYAYPDRKGKAHATNLAMTHAKGCVCVFSDANVMYDKHAVRKLVRNFADPSVGCVTGNVSLTSPGPQSTGESFYMRYERFIHERESHFATAVGTDGAMYALRRKLYKPLRPDTILDDLMTAMRAVEMGLRIVYEKEAVGVEPSAADTEQEFKRKVRITAGGFQLLAMERWLLNPLRRPDVFLLFLSHKVFRWVLPWTWAVNLASNVFLLGSHLSYRVFFAVQLLFFSLALGAFLIRGLRTYAMFRMPLYLMAINVAAGAGLLRYLSGKQQVTWHKARQ
jgi:poly-beta-1,6-N-acetyl-D-glucosamine synthase